MKKIYLIFLLVSTLTIFHTAMASETISLTPSIEEIVDAIDGEINARFSHSVFSNTVIQLFLTEEKMSTIISVAMNKTNDIPLTDECIGQLSEKNSFFNSAINYFIDLARKAIDNVTCDTIEVIESPHLPHPVMSLNTFPNEIKKFILNKAIQNIDHSLTITIGLSEGDKIMHSCALCPATDTLACAVDSAISFYDLKSMEWIKHLQTLFPPLQLCFNTNGSRIASLENEQNYTINIRLVNSEDVLYSIKSIPNIIKIDFFDSEQHNILSVIKKDNNNNCTQTPYYFKDNKAHAIGTLCLGPAATEYNPLRQTKGNYTTYPFADVLYVTKKNCNALYICGTAINNTNNQNALKKILETHSYGSLSAYEQSIINEHITRQIKILTAMGKLNRMLSLTSGEQEEQKKLLENKKGPH